MPSSDPARTPPSGQAAHFAALEAMYAAAPVNALYDSRMEIPAEGQAHLHFTVEEKFFHAAEAAHGSLYFKMLDDAAFYAANTLVSDRFLLTTSFNLLFTRPMAAGEAVAEGRWISGRRRVLVAEARIVGPDGEECARGTGTFMRSRTPLSTLAGYGNG